MGMISNITITGKNYCFVHILVNNNITTSKIVLFQTNIIFYDKLKSFIAILYYILNYKELYNNVLICLEKATDNIMVKIQKS